MQTSIAKIEKNAMYGFINNENSLATEGISLAVLEIEDERVKGIRLLLNGNKNFNMSKDEFYRLIDTDRLAFIEILPGFVIKTLKKGYANNLKHHNNDV